MLAYNFFFTFWLCFLSHRAGWVFFLFLFFTCIFNSLCNFSHYKFGRAIFTRFCWQKKKAAKRWPCYSGEWKQARHDKYLSLLLDVFSVWKPWHWGIKMKWKGEETETNWEREKILPKKKGGGGGKGKFEWFLCTRKKRGEWQTTVWTFQGGDTLVTSSTHFPCCTRLSDKSPPLPNARHEGTRNVSYRSSSLCCRTACSYDASRGNFDGWCAYTCMGRTVQ